MDESNLEHEAERELNFLPALVPLADAFNVEPPRPQFWIESLLPERVVTLLGAHGGTGKTTLALVMAVCLVAGLPFMGKATRRAKVLFYSAEDPPEVLLWQLSRICRHMGQDPRELEGRLLLLDATDVEPVLYTAISDGGIQHGITTAVYEHLKEYDASVLIIDNASDTYDAGENERPRVRGFIRALARLVKKRAGAVLLLAHIDKLAARTTGNTEGYSGSTAWHNSVRSRMFMSDRDGELILEHQKSNYGPRAEPITLQWSDDGVPELVAPGASLSGLVASSDRQAVVDLIAEFYERGEYLPTSPNAPGNAYRTLKDEPGFPKRMDRGRFFRVLRDAERSGQIERETYTNSARKKRERWKPAPTSCALSPPYNPHALGAVGAPVRRVVPC